LRETADVPRLDNYTRALSEHFSYAANVACNNGFPVGHRFDDGNRLPLSE
jgi:hypothetical protein